MACAYASQESARKDLHGGHPTRRGQARRGAKLHSTRPFIGELVSSLGSRLQSREETVESAVLRSSCRLAVLDHFRVPYKVGDRWAPDGVEALYASCNGRSLLWTTSRGGRAVASTVLGVDGRLEVPLFVEILSDRATQPLLDEFGGTWETARQIRSTDGVPIGSIRRRQDGTIFLPFDPNEVVENFWSERYLAAGPGQRVRALRRTLRLTYYRARPLLPRRLQILLRRHLARLQARSTFPRWPVETCMHDFFELMLAIVGDVIGQAVPCIAPWPDGHDWALVLTHDVEGEEGFAALDRILELERGHGLRSSWNLVPQRYEVDDARVHELIAAGFEVGVHGLHHDGRDLESLTLWRQRLPAAYDAARRWGAVGFRSAAMHRKWDWMRLLSFDYDSSSPDTDPYEPQDGGCCTWLPFFNGQIVELPLTLAQDHTLFVILGQPDERAWVEKAEFLRGRGGMAMLDTHPDYLVDERIFAAYRRFLERFAEDETAWRALPREVSAWWRRRAASWLEHDGEDWRLVGPAANEGRLVLVEITW